MGKLPKFLTLSLSAAAVFTLLYFTFRPSPDVTPVFDGQRAYRSVLEQVAFGPRIPGSQAKIGFLQWLQERLESMGWKMSTQPVLMMGHSLTNVIAYKGSKPPEFLLGAHYDSRMRADRDPDPSRRSQAVPGANDGASGVAVLLELARVLPEELAQWTWIVFFDGEDNGDLPGWDWILGSRAFVAETKIAPQVAIILDMVGDADLNIYIERSSDPSRAAAIWASASALGYSQAFLPSPKYQMIDDHLPFVEQGIPSVLIIDFDYPYWHTTADTADKISPESLQIVGRTLLNWFLTQK